jgi:hypothetical protein
MDYRQITFLVSGFFATGSLVFFLAGILFVPFGIAVMVFFFLLAFLFFIVLITPEWRKMTEIYVVSRFGSRKDNDLLEHFGNIFFSQMINAKIATQVNITSEDEMMVFADGLINMFGPNSIENARFYYPDVADDYWKVCLVSLLSLEKNIMLKVFFPEKHGDLIPEKTEEEFAINYPYLHRNTLYQLIKWWRTFKTKMEWQDRMDGIQR